jgi:hypothetical protein
MYELGAQYQTLMDVTCHVSTPSIGTQLYVADVACPGSGFPKCRFQCYAYIFRVNSLELVTVLKNFPSMLRQV